MKKITYLLLFLFIAVAAGAQADAGYSGWIAKASAFYEAGQYRQSADAYTKAFASNNGTGMRDDRYNAACAWSLAGNNDSAFFQLEKTIARDQFANYNQLAIDPDLDNLHSDKRWDSTLALVKQNWDNAKTCMFKALSAHLDTIYQDDQKYRMRLDAVMSKYGRDSKEMKTLASNMNRSDSVNLVKVEAILDKSGWPGPMLVGALGSEAIFLVIQHADLKTQEKYLPVMREAVKTHVARPADLALLEDRVAIGEGRKQIYGSQIEMDMDGSFLAPLEDPDHVDERRETAGLEPLAEYLQNFHLAWNVEEYKKQLPSLEKRISKMQFK
jgi:hypothetical protein